MHVTPNLMLANALAGMLFGLFNLMCGFIKPQPVGQGGVRVLRLGKLACCTSPLIAQAVLQHASCLARAEVAFSGVCLPNAGCPALPCLKAIPDGWIWMYWADPGERQKPASELPLAAGVPCSPASKCSTRPGPQPSVQCAPLPEQQPRARMLGVLPNPAAVAA